ncbi:hypothetical protein COU49_02185 [Candidatus Nomurabacteria bacterium CG10_big_fil_rev_8_21_14_0_10_35_16]|uniref:Type II secretion system protein n=1 Tax=Candidatus Nomurabacteria bacterium CG10_big_fil_rev_8_21_14_0_10_35_16 TaxID=1974731 RepID=A0A2H0TAX5_9BACT|nr:MAG: hypothetical protein COU49_02185 [Candidatus Nomurabacteria bacterium CG10_big_fil_rev_8_21_14_0_10_35_16]
MPLAEFKLTNMFYIFSKKESGYTIIETMIAVSIFLVVIMYGMGSLLNANVLHRKSQDVRSILDNLNFVVEDISRNLRIGYNYQCFSGADILSPGTLSVPKSCASGWGLAFESPEGDPEDYNDQWVYYVSNDGKVFKSTNGANSFIQLTPDEVVIDAISGFAVLGAEPPSTNTQQPLVLIKLVGSITTREVTTPFSLQTSISQRLLDI